MKLDKKISKEMSDLMHDSTIAGVGGSGPYMKAIDSDQAEQNIKVIEQQMRDRAGDSKEKFFRDIKELRMMIAFEKKRKLAYPALKKRFNQLARKSPDAARIYNQSRDHHETHFADTLEALKERIGDSKVSPEVKKNLITQLRLKFESLQAQAPYFPLARFGDYWVHTADGDETRFNMFESEAEQDLFVKQMNQEGIEILGRGKRLENLSEIEGVSAEFITEVDSLISDLGDVPMAGLLLENPAIAMSMMADGHYERGLEYMMPKAVKDGMKAVRYSTNGVENLRGDRIKDDYSIIEGIGQILGFSSSEISEIYDQNNAIKRIKNKRDDRRQSLLSKAANARIDGDNETFNEAKEEIREFNKKNPGLKITIQNIRQSIRDNKRRSNQTENGLYLPKRSRDLAN